MISLLLPLIGLIGCSASQPPKTTAAPTAPAKPLFTPPGILSPAAPTKPAAYAPIMLGIDVLEAEGFAAVKGKRIGLVTHPAGVNRRGISTVEVLRRAPGVKLVALFAGEHGLYA
ncbi:MAG TPA: exo-beta-N-acetylmuramidase NamZ domain-containing protein, partial [Opitutaceae bacterium]